MSKVRAILAAVITAVAGGAGIYVALDDAETTHGDLTCIEAQLLVGEEMFPGDDAEKRQIVEDACGSETCRKPNRTICRNGRLYGPGVGGTLPGGTPEEPIPATCTCGVGDSWHPSEVIFGVDPEDVAAGRRYRPAEAP